jgi:hypothetical protein
MNEELSNNPELNKQVQTENIMKTWLVQYVGEKHKPQNGIVTLAMIIESMAQEFPDFIFALAEENFIRGYQQALYDVDYKPEEGKLPTSEQIAQSK